MDRKQIKCVAVIQCAVAHERCTGSFCAQSFANRTHYFAGYGEAAIYYIPFGCGGCPGRRVSRLAAQLSKTMQKAGVAKDEIAVHLASCVVTDNGHYPPCPHLADMKKMLARKGLHVVEGSHVSPSAERKRAAGLYAARPAVEEDA